MARMLIYYRSCHDYSGNNSRPICVHSDRNQFAERLFIIASTILLAVEIFSMLTLFYTTQYRTKWYCNFMCLETLWCIKFITRAITPYLFLFTIVVQFGPVCRNVLANILNHISSLVASVVLHIFGVGVSLVHKFSMYYTYYYGWSLHSALRSIEHTLLYHTTLDTWVIRMEPAGF